MMILYGLDLCSSMLPLLTLASLVAAVVWLAVTLYRRRELFRSPEFISRPDYRMLAAIVLSTIAMLSVS